jgi:hypothetical protein
MTRDEPSGLRGAEIDREIESMMRVQPSVEYLTRIRTRIALEPPPAAALPRWLVPAGGLVAAAIIALVSVSHSIRTAPLPGDAGRLATASMPVPPTPASAPMLQGRPVPHVALKRDPTATASAYSHGRRTTRPSPARAEVLIAQDEAQALRRFIVRASSGEVRMARATFEYPSLEPEPLADIVVRPIAIDPLVSADPEEGARQ